MEQALVVGSGVIGCLAALELVKRGYRTTIFEAEAQDALTACSFSAGGMLSPVSELDQGEPLVYEYGKDAVRLWRHILCQFGSEDLLGAGGGLYAAYRAEEGLLQRVANRITSHFPSGVLSVLSAPEVERLCPGLGQRFGKVFHFDREGYVDAQALVIRLRKHLQQHCAMHFLARVDQVAPGSIRVAGKTMAAQLVVDCRGMGAQSDFSQLRGVRGEALMVRAPGFKLNIPLRVVHSRTTVYVVPRPDGEFYVGATSLETADDSPIRLRSAIELMNALYAIHPEFKEAAVTKLMTGVRPAFRNNFPGYTLAPGLIRINGFYRHGFLLGPAVCERVIAAYCDNQPLGTLEAYKQKAVEHENCSEW